MNTKPLNLENHLNITLRLEKKIWLLPFVVGTKVCEQRKIYLICLKNDYLCPESMNLNKRIKQHIRGK